MSVTDYECAQCGQLADVGRAFIVINIIPNEHKLELECPNKMHHSWPTSVEVRCPKCGRVPEYTVDGSGTVPFLSCCGRKWIPEGHGPNKFADERTI